MVISLAGVSCPFYSWSTMAAARRQHTPSRAASQQVLTLAWLVVAAVASAGASSSGGTITEALAVLGTNTTGIAGSIRFSRGPSCSVVATATLVNLRPNAAVGFHIHVLGNVSGGCASAGAHWNPTAQNHSSPNSTASHAGDLGNAVANSSGVAIFTITNPTLSRFGLAALYGRTVIVHNATDDMGLGGAPDSLTTGNAGARIACAVIGRTSVNVTLASGECPDWTATAASAASAPVVGIATIAENSTSGISGAVRFSSDAGTVKVEGLLSGLGANAQFGFHVHEFGDLSSGCSSTGQHWNPTGNQHGPANSSQSHAGDLGNVASGADGTATIAVSNPVMSAQGVYALLGRAVVVHAVSDDLGVGPNDASKINGNAGARIACAVIGIASGSSYGPPTNASSASTSTPPNVTSVLTSTLQSSNGTPMVAPRGERIFAAYFVVAAVAFWRR